MLSDLLFSFNIVSEFLYVIPTFCKTIFDCCIGFIKWIYHCLFLFFIFIIFVC